MSKHHLRNGNDLRTDTQCRELNHLIRLRGGQMLTRTMFLDELFALEKRCKEEEPNNITHQSHRLKRYADAIVGGDFVSFYSMP